MSVVENILMAILVMERNNGGYRKKYNNSYQKKYDEYEKDSSEDVQDNE